MKVVHLNMGVPIRVSTALYAVEAGVAPSRAAQQRAKLEELRAHMEAEGWAGEEPHRPPLATTAKPDDAAVFRTLPAAPASDVGLAARAEQAQKDLQAKQSEMRLAAAMQKVRERYRSSGSPVSDTNGKVSHG